MNEKQSKFLEIFRANACLVYRSCSKAKITPPTFYNWQRDCKEFKQAIDDEKELLLDNCESALYNAILKGNLTAVIFYLKTRGKSRGYSEIESVNDKPFELIQLVKASNASAN